MNEFARSADVERYRDIVRRVQEADRKDDKRRKDKKDNEDKERDAGEDAALEIMAFATAAELERFDVTMTHYHDATYEALLENDRLTAEAQRELQDMLDRAYTLPDGRRVFESEDGIRVFDEFGRELDADTVTAEEIDDGLPKWEALQTGRRDYDLLINDRKAIIEYQLKLDEAEERRSEGGLTSDELRAIENELAESMPDSVRNELAAELRPTVNAEIAQPEGIAPIAAAAPIRDVPTF